jgi:hypothetical protein
MTVYLSSAVVSCGDVPFGLPCVEVLAAPRGQRLNDELAPRIMAEHRRDAAGVCVGCVYWWGHLIRHPCTALVWARLVRTNG